MHSSTVKYRFFKKILMTLSYMNLQSTFCMILSSSPMKNTTNTIQAAPNRSDMCGTVLKNST